MHTLYTWGYTGTHPTDLLAYVEALHALLIDVRFVPWSRVPYWRKAALMELVGAERYLHLRALGNENYKGGPIKLHAPAAVVEPVRAVLRERPAILLCACADPAICHRSVAATYLARQLGVHGVPPVLA